MKIINTIVGSHCIQMSINSSRFLDFIHNNFKLMNDYKLERSPDITLLIVEGFGTSFRDFNVSITRNSKKVYFRRADYLIETDQEYKNATIFVYDELALKHALMNIYSSYIVYNNWGLLIHSSSAIENGKAHIFVGQSGAGKSTAARLSQPRDLFSDEATVIRITSKEIEVFNSPFRSEIYTTGAKWCVTLASIQLLHQSLQNKRLVLSKGDAFIHLMDKIFYWSHDPEETKKIMGLLKMLVDRVSVYELYFKKDNTFWELIS
jgi:hypothetical protein